MQTMTHDSTSEAFTRSVLDAIGCPREQTHSILQIAIPVVTLVAMALATFLLISIGKEDELLEGLAFIVAAGGFALGLVQWNLSRHEVSFDRFYERISLANHYINEVGLREAANKEQELDHVKNMRVFAQLDNLEYVLGKYELKFVGFDIVDRGMRTFVAECDQPWFREKVLFWIGRAEEEQVAKGYHALTRKAARHIVAASSAAKGSAAVPSTRLNRGSPLPAARAPPNPLPRARMPGKMVDLSRVP